MRRGAGRNPGSVLLLHPCASPTTCPGWKATRTRLLAWCEDRRGRRVREGWEGVRGGRGLPGRGRSCVGGAVVGEIGGPRGISDTKGGGARPRGLCKQY